MTDYRKKQKGDAMIAVLCVLAVLMVLATSLLTISNIIVTNNQSYPDQIQCKLANRSFSTALQNRLSDKNDSFTVQISNLMNQPSWKYYNSNENDIDYFGSTSHDLTDKTFKVIDGDIEHEVTLYYETDKDRYINPLERELVVIVVTRYNDQVYQNRTRYARTMNGSDYVWYPSAEDAGG